ncbi:MAG TPA: class I SAM-dependent methyltransferase [Ktedonobacteraceae bacterium]|nr:class I SAM-dependent methyltransferase [Ktedonobacteraceae bacterium]
MTTHSDNAYPIDTESGAEMARLLDQDLIVTEAMGGLLPERGNDLAGIERVVDFGCGPGGWVQELAFANPQVEVLGIDISKAMVAYGTQQAQVRGLENLRFRVADITKPLPLEDNTFDLVNTRTIAGFMTPGDWPALVQEARRILRPGGIFRLTEAEWGFTNSGALEKLCFLTNQALHRAGKTLSPNGYYLGITPMLAPFLRSGGFVNVQQQAHALNYSAGQKGNYGCYQDMRAMFPLLKPFFLQLRMFDSEEEFEQLYQRALADMLADDFSCLGYALTVWGEKPEEA